MAGQGTGGELLGDLVSTLPEEIPALKRIHRKYVSNGVEVVGIALDNVLT